MRGCEDSAAYCLADHIVPKLHAVTLVKGTNSQYTALCPAHDDGGGHGSLSITVADKAAARFVMQCHSPQHCGPAEIRAALIARGVPDGCLPRFKHQRTEDELVAALLPLLKEPGTGPLFKLRIAALVLNEELPRGGKELEDFAAQWGIGKSQAYEATAELRGRKRNGSRRKAAGPGGAGGQPRPHRDNPSETATQNPSASPQVDGPRNGYAADRESGPADRESGPASRSVAVPFDREPGPAVSPVPEPGLAVSPQRCAICGRELPLDHRTDRKTCSPRCRSALHRRNNRKDNRP